VQPTATHTELDLCLPKVFAVLSVEFVALRAIESCLALKCQGGVFSIRGGEYDGCDP